MKMDYKDDQFWLMKGDCLGRMKEIPDNSIDLVLCDPPYGTTRNKWDSIINFELLWIELNRICNGAIVMTAQAPFDKLLACSNLGMFKYEWIWEKNKATGHLNAKKMPMKSHENVLVFYKKPPTYNPQMTNGHKPANHAVNTGTGSNYGKQSTAEYGGNTTRYPRSVIQIPVINNDDPDKVHPTQKPVELMEYFVNTYTNENETVLDFTMGSGTTGVACRNLNRKFIGIEMDDNYFNICKNRILTKPVSLDFLL
jgi:site-specific DNA-methyltransferase (adenine-specific)